MGNAQYLEDAIKCSGKKKGYLADRIGVTRQTFTKKCKDPSSFTNLQVSVLCAELEITRLTDRAKIFG
jgi:hypothetical protein